MALAFASSTAYGRACAARGTSTDRGGFLFRVVRRASEGREHSLGIGMTIGTRGNFV